MRPEQTLGSLPLILGLLVACGDNESPEPPTSHDADALDLPETEDAAADVLETLGEVAEPSDTSTRPEVTLATYPRVDGSTSNLPLAMTIGSELLGLPYSYILVSLPESDPAEELNILPYGRTEAERALAGGLTQTLVHHKTHDAYLRLIHDLTDLILVASPPSPDERAEAEQAGVTLQWETVALDALVFMVSAQSPITELTTAQIQGIYTGAITNWSEVGGPDAAIQPYTRPENSGSQQLMEALVMQGLTMPEWPPDLKPTFMGALVEALKADPAGIGFSVYYYVTHQYPIDALALVAVDGQLSSPDSIAKGDYPLVAPVLVVVREDLDRASLAWRLRDWLLGPDGQRVVASSGYVPVHAASPLPPAPVDRPVCDIRNREPDEGPAGSPCNMWAQSGELCPSDERCAPACDSEGSLAGGCLEWGWVPGPLPGMDEPCPEGACAAGLVCAWGHWDLALCRPLCDPWAEPGGDHRCTADRWCFRMNDAYGEYVPDTDTTKWWIEPRPYGFCAPAQTVGTATCARGEWCYPRERDASGRWRCDCVD